MVKTCFYFFCCCSWGFIALGKLFPWREEGREIGTTAPFLLKTCKKIVSEVLEARITKSEPQSHVQVRFIIDFQV